LVQALAIVGSLCEYELLTQFPVTTAPDQASGVESLLARAALNHGKLKERYQLTTYYQENPKFLNTDFCINGITFHGIGLAATYYR